MSAVIVKMCDRWKCRRLCLTRLAEISGELVGMVWVCSKSCWPLDQAI